MANTVLLAGGADFIGSHLVGPLGAEGRGYVSDPLRFEEATGSSVRVPFEEGIRRLHDWLIRTPQGAMERT